jgi:hypothetical protein
MIKKNHFQKIFLILSLLVIFPHLSFADEGDVFTTFSDAQHIHGVNWGMITPNSTSINIGGVHLIPFDDVTEPFYYEVEYGTTTPGGDNTFIGSTAPILAPPYDFNISLPNLLPNTNYYFTILEYYPPGDPNYGAFNLFTYGYATTGLLNNSSIYHNFPNFNSLNVYGTLVPGGGATMTNLPIKIVLQNASHTDLTSADTVTGGGGYFSKVFSDLPSVGIVPQYSPGGQYYIVIRNNSSDNHNDLIEPIPFTVPFPSSDASSSVTTSLDFTASTTGLIACSGADCDFDGLLATINNVMNFLILYIAFPIVAVVVAWAGVLLLTSGGNTSAKDKAKGMISNVIIGLIIALLAWGIIKLILVTLGYNGPLLNIFSS